MWYKLLKHRVFSTIASNDNNDVTSNRSNEGRNEMKQFSIFKLLQICIFFLGVIFLTACGGGGNDSPEPSIDLSTKTDAEIIDLSAETYKASDFIPDDGINILAGNKSAAIAQTNSLSKMARDLFVAKTEACENAGGTVDFPDDPNANFGALTFTNCTFGGTTANGQVVISVSNVAGFDVKLEFNSFSMQDAANKVSISGTILSGSSFSGNVRTYQSRIIERNLVFQISSAKINDTFTFSNFDEVYTEDNANGVKSLTVSYSVSTLALNGKLSLNTLTTIKQNYYLDSYPYEGVFEIVGGNGGKALVTILGDGSSSGLVRVEIDKDGNGVYESSYDVPWSEFSK